MGLDNQEEVMQKEIQSLKRKTLYLGVVTAAIMVNLIFSTATQVRYYASIRDYYQHSLNLDQEQERLWQEQNRILEELIPKLEDIQLRLQVTK